MVRPKHEHEDGAAEQRAERGAADAGDDEAVVVVRVRRWRVRSAVAGAVAAAGREARRVDEEEAVAVLAVAKVGPLEQPQQREAGVGERLDGKPRRGLSGAL